MKNFCVKLRKEIERALEGLEDVPFDILSNRHICLQQNISLLKSPGIIIVSLSEYRKLVFAELTLKEALERGYGLSMPKKTKQPSRGTMQAGKGSCGSCSSGKRGRLSLVRG